MTSFYTKCQYNSFKWQKNDANIKETEQDTDEKPIDLMWGNGKLPIGIVWDLNITYTVHVYRRCSAYIYKYRTNTEQGQIFNGVFTKAI